MHMQIKQMFNKSSKHFQITIQKAKSKTCRGQSINVQYRVGKKNKRANKVGTRISNTVISGLADTQGSKVVLSKVIVN